MKSKWKFSTIPSQVCCLFFVVVFTLEGVQGQYVRPDQQYGGGSYGRSGQNYQNYGRDYGQQGDGQNYGQDGRSYYSTSGYQQSNVGGLPQSQSQDSFGRPVFNSPTYTLNDPNARYNPAFPPVSRITCNPPGGASQTIIVKTKLGEVSGLMEYICDHPDTMYQQRRPNIPGQPMQVFGNVSVFLGIPYAAAPIRDRRFRPPVEYGGWHRLEAYSYRPACPQPPGIKDNTGRPVPMDEDCLFLNIFTPSVAGYGEAYPVMIYIHGGEFESGTSAYFPGHMLAAAMKVVVVTFNYRLGALGFFSTGERESPGNYGLLDQSMAIRWVYDNIASFYGNPLKITLFGSDAGAASAGLHMLSPRSRELFQTVIAQDGSAVADWGVITNLERARNTSRVFAEKVGCDANSFQRLVQCLRNRSPRELTEFSLKPQVGFFPWAPVVDKNISMLEQHRFLPNSPEDIIARGQFDTNKVYVTGVTRDAGAYVLLQDLALSVVNYQVNHLYFRQKINDYIKMYNYTLNAQGAFNAILYAYTNWADPKNETLTRDSYVNMLSDAIYKAPVDKMVKLLSEKGVKTYMYLFNTSVESLRRPQWQAVPHNAEWYFITGAPFLDTKYFPLIDPLYRATVWTEEDRKMSDLMMKLWSNFAKYRGPVQPNVPYIVWDPVLRNQMKYISINTTRYSHMAQDYRQTECAFWNVYMLTLWGPAPPTYPPYFMPWWQYEQPLQIGFWSAITVCLLLFVMLMMMCCLYCRIAGHNKPRSVDFDDSVSRDHDEYALTTPNEVEITKINNKQEKKEKEEKQDTQDTQHTSV